MATLTYVQFDAGNSKTNQDALDPGVEELPDGDIAVVMTDSRTPDTIGFVRNSQLGQCRVDAPNHTWIFDCTRYNLAETGDWDGDGFTELRFTPDEGPMFEVSFQTQEEMMTERDLSDIKWRHQPDAGLIADGRGILLIGTGYRTENTTYVTYLHDKRNDSFRNIDGEFFDHVPEKSPEE